MADQNTTLADLRATVREFVDARDWREVPATAESQAALESVGVGDAAPVVVHENAGFEDITLEGERIRIEAPAEDQVTEIDLDSTDELEILRHVPDSAYPEDDEEAEREIEAFVQALEEAPVPAAEAPFPVF